jgi:hypothetical protein
LNDLPPKLRGPSQNRYGGHRSQNIRVFRGSTFGAANQGRSLSPDEIAQQEERLREMGLI